MAMHINFKLQWTTMESNETPHPEQLANGVCITPKQVDLKLCHQPPEYAISGHSYNLVFLNCSFGIVKCGLPLPRAVPNTNVAKFIFKYLLIVYNVDPWRRW